MGRQRMVGLVGHTFPLVGHTLEGVVEGHTVRPSCMLGVEVAHMGQQRMEEVVERTSALVVRILVEVLGVGVGYSNWAGRLGSRPLGTLLGTVAGLVRSQLGSLGRTWVRACRLGEGVEHRVVRHMVGRVERTFAWVGRRVEVVVGRQGLRNIQAVLRIVVGKGQPREGAAVT